VILTPIPIRTNLANALTLQVLEAQVRADALPRHVLDVMRELHSAPAALAGAVLTAKETMR
jgi:hypothetical protein